MHDILEKRLPETYDAIVLANVLCHFAEGGRKLILENVHASLARNGWLICECCYYGSASGDRMYSDWMRDLTSFGFRKPNVVIPSWYGKKMNVTGSSRIYRKI